MPRAYSSRYREKLDATAGREPPLLLREITHPDLAAPIRIANAPQDLVSQGNLFAAFAFRATLPDDLDQGLPRAQLAVDNIGRELTHWLEDSAGGADASVRLMQVLRSDPDTIEWEVRLTLKNVQMDV